MRLSLLGPTSKIFHGPLDLPTQERLEPLPMLVISALKGCITAIMVLGIQPLPIAGQLQCQAEGVLSVQFSGDIDDGREVRRVDVVGAVGKQVAMAIDQFTERHGRVGHVSQFFQVAAHVRRQFVV